MEITNIVAPPPIDFPFPQAYNMNFLYYSQPNKKLHNSTMKS